MLTGQDIAEAQGAVRALLDSVLRPTGVTGDEYVVLRLLTQRGPDRRDDLRDYLAGQRQLRLTADGATALLDAVTAKGLATGGDDIALTDGGARTHADLNRRVGAVTQELYGAFTPADLATAHAVLVGVTARAAQLAG
jgi:hypothetical protein